MMTKNNDMMKQVRAFLETHEVRLGHLDPEAFYGKPAARANAGADSFGQCCAYYLVPPVGGSRSIDDVVNEAMHGNKTYADLPDELLARLKVAYGEHVEETLVLDAEKLAKHMQMTLQGTLERACDIDLIPKPTNWHKGTYVWLNETFAARRGIGEFRTKRTGRREEKA